MDNYKEKSEQLLIDMIKQKEKYDKKLLDLEIYVGIVGLLMFLISTLSMSYIVSLYPGTELFCFINILLLTILLFIFAFLLCKIEQEAGYYECQKCKNKYVPTYKNVLFAPHYGRTRYMKCPKCNQKSWQKKVLTKE